jgi:hypothetical protein
LCLPEIRQDPIHDRDGFIDLDRITVHSLENKRVGRLFSVTIYSARCLLLLHCQINHSGHVVKSAHIKDPSRFCRKMTVARHKTAAPANNVNHECPGCYTRSVQRSRTKRGGTSLTVSGDATVVSISQALRNESVACFHGTEQVKG